MIIQNNFNKRSSEPLNNYQCIGKGRNAQNYGEEQDKHIKENLNNRVIQDIMHQDNEFDDNSREDKWDFFR